MKKFFVLFLILILVQYSALTEGIDYRPITPVNGLTFPVPEKDEFSFAVIGDIRMPFKGKRYSTQTLQMLNEMNIIGPSLVMCVGDAYFGYGESFRRFRDEIEYFLSTIEPLGMPFFNVIGNHDVAGNGKKRAYVREKFGNSYGSFDFGNSHFIVLDTEEKRGEIRGDQLKWLKGDLEANKNAGHIFVFMHRPLFSAFPNDGAWKGFFTDTANRDTLTLLFRTYHVSAVFAGHEHLYRDSVIDGVRYITTGGGGAPLFVSRKNGGFHHFLIVKVEGAAYSVDTLKPDDLTVRTISGNNGRDVKTVVEISNKSSSDLGILNLTVRMPSARRQKYLIHAVEINSSTTGTLSPKIRRIEKNGSYDSVSLGIRLLPDRTARISLIQREAESENAEAPEIRRGDAEARAPSRAPSVGND